MDDSTRMLVAQRCGSPDVWVVPDMIVVRFWPAATDRQRIDAMRSVQAKAVVFLPLARRPRDGIHMLWIRPTGQCDSDAAASILNRSPAVAYAMPEMLYLNLVERPPT